MSAAQIMAALSTVEQDHRLVLEKMQALKGAVSCLLESGDGDAGVRCVLVRLRESNRFFAGRFEAHLEEEERTLFPFLERQKPEGPALVACLRQEHAEIRRLRDELGKCLGVAFEIEDDPPRMVLRGLRLGTVGGAGQPRPRRNAGRPPGGRPLSPADGRQSARRWRSGP